MSAAMQQLMQQAREIAELRARIADQARRIDAFLNAVQPARS